MMKEVNVNNFEEEVLKSEIPVLVDFWAAWCGPCKMVAPVLADVSKDFQGKAKFVKVNVDENAELASKFKILSIPTIMVFKNGEVADDIVGFRPKNVISELLEKYI
ncbi:MAG: thioredoxin [Clostridiaceae bacterium]